MLGEKVSPDKNISSWTPTGYVFLRRQGEFWERKHLRIELIKSKLIECCACKCNRVRRVFSRSDNMLLRIESVRTYKQQAHYRNPTWTLGAKPFINAMYLSSSKTPSPQMWKTDRTTYVLRSSGSVERNFA